MTKTNSNTKRNNKRKKLRMQREKLKVMDKRLSKKMAATRPKGVTLKRGDVPSLVKRSFLGKTEGFENRQEQLFEQKHLNAYLQGYERFQYGYRNIISPSGLSVGREPVWHTVQQSIEAINN